MIPSRGGLTMALAESLSAVRYKSDLCPVSMIYEKLPKDDQQAFDNAVEKQISTNGLLTALLAEGYAISWASVERHLKKICKCNK
jgi:hypothetical protein